jgi:hypothetical protein
VEGDPQPLTLDPDADPHMAELDAMTTAEFKTYIKDEIAFGERVPAKPPSKQYSESGSFFVEKT